MNKLNLITIACSLIFIVLFSPKHLNAQCNIDDWNGLKALYESTDISNKNLSGWNYNFDGRNSPVSNCNLGSLYGISLNNNGRIDKLRIYSKNIVGSIPPQIGNLTKLEILYLNNNALSGNIPSTIGNLVNLINLSFYNNQLSGDIPSTIGNLTNVDYMHLGENQLTAIPPEIGGLTNLTRLFIFDNQLAGNLPSEIGNLNSLEILDLNNNQLSGTIPTEINNLINLSVLFLSNNQFSGTTPLGLSNLNELFMLNLSHNQLNGNIPTEIGNLTNLYHLNLSNNKLNGNIPFEVFSLVNLVSLVLSHNQLSGTISPLIGNLNTLEELNLAYNNLTGSLPFEIVGVINHNFETLFNIDISNNQLSGCYPAGLAEKLCLTEYNSFPEFYRHIDEGNNFDAFWDDFCNTEQGACTANCTITDFEIVSLTGDNVEVVYNLIGNPSYYAVQTKHCELALIGEDCITDLWTEVPDALEGDFFEPCNTYSFRMMMICEGDTLYSNEADYFFEDEICNTATIPPNCDYDTWLWDEWFMQQNCEDCPFNVELIEFNGDQYIAVWETVSTQIACADYLSSVYNCDGTIFCNQGGFVGFDECTDADLPYNYTVLEILYNFNDACLNCINTCDCSLPKDRGPCNSEIDVLRWYFDQNTNTCQQFYYGGCGGNENNYTSFETCMQACDQYVNCPNTLYLGTNTLSSGVYQASQNTTHKGQIETGGNVVLKAGNSIQIKSGFSTQGCSSFKAMISNCE